MGSLEKIGSVITGGAGVVFVLFPRQTYTQSPPGAVFPSLLVLEVPQVVPLKLSPADCSLDVPDSLHVVDSAISIEPVIS